MFLVLGSFSCGNQQATEEGAEKTVSNNSPLKKLEWILGEWSNQTKEGTIGEKWIFVNDSLFSGEGYSLNKMDTVFKEMLSLLVHEGELYYVPTVSGQNDNQPVWFKIVEIKENFFRSENKQHDFPQIISYSSESPAALLAVIEGPIDSIETKREFRYRRAKVRLMP
ncbi:MAG: hypothetical protein KA444_10695 [Bacteroidia bacterium]|nr:hypothetical protein [Bacteroidia bacterium]